MVARRRKRIAQRKKARNGKRIQSNKPFISHLPNHIRRRLFFSSHSPSSHSHAHSSPDCHTQEEPIFLFTNVLPAFLKYSLFFVCLPRKSPNCDTLLSKPSLQMPSVCRALARLLVGDWTLVWEKYGANFVQTQPRPHQKSPLTFSFPFQHLHSHSGIEEVEEGAEEDPSRAHRLNKQITPLLICTKTVISRPIYWHWIQELHSCCRF